MAALTALAAAVVVASGLWLVGLGVAAIFAPARTGRFLGLFASSARAHYTEQLLRLVAGAALLVHAPRMRFPEAFRLFGWVLVVSAAALLLVPWRWHQRFAQWVIPPTIRYLPLLAAVSLALGAFVLYAVL